MITDEVDAKELPGWLGITVTAVRDEPLRQRVGAIQSALLCYN
jgi:hypothetical protein